MGKDIKELIGDIITTTDNSYPTSSGNVNVVNPPLTFDRGAFREKLSLNVLRDIVHAMLADDYEDMDGMIDKSIINHINDDYNGSCYNYLCRSKDATKSPMIADIIERIDETVDETENKLILTKDPTVAGDSIDALELEKSVDNYKDFRDMIKKKVSEKVINSVVAELIGNTDTPTFKDKLDKSLEEKRKERDNEPDSNENNNDMTVGPENMIQPAGESVIITATGKIYAESARSGIQRSYDDCMREAILEYCLTNLDFCWKQHTKNNFHDKYIYKK